MNDAPAGRVTVALVNDYEVVVRGLAEMLAEAPRLQVVELDSMTDPTAPVDLVLFDSFAAESGVGPDLRHLLDHPHVGRLVVYTWNTDPELVRTARAAGAAGYLSKRLPAGELVDALQRVADGEEVFEVDAPGASDDCATGDWPGRPAGLTPREAEVIGLIVQGLTNQQIAARAYLSINSVKTYIRSAYRKMGVQRRSQAILWGLDHGFLPRPSVTRLSDSAPSAPSPR